MLTRVRGLIPYVAAITLLASVGLLAAAQEVQAQTTCTTECWIATTGSDVTGDGSQANPFATIAAALAAVTPGGVVHVAAGTYPATYTKITKSVTFMGDPGAGDPGPGPNAPVIDGGGASTMPSTSPTACRM